MTTHQVSCVTCLSIPQVHCTIALQKKYIIGIEGGRTGGHLRCLCVPLMCALYLEELGASGGVHHPWLTCATLWAKQFIAPLGELLCNGGCSHKSTA